MGCRIEIWSVDKDGTLTYEAAPGRKYRLWDVVDDRFLENKSGSALLEYGSRRAAMRGHDKFCRHEKLPQIDGSEKARDNAAELRDPEDEACDECGEDGNIDDPLAEWYTPWRKNVLAHGQCGLDAGWRQA